MLINTNLVYSATLILSNTKKNFTAMGRSLNVCGDTISRSLNSAEVSFEEMENLAQQQLKNTDTVFFLVDDTKLPKDDSKKIDGTDRHYCQKAGRKITAIGMICFSVSDGEHNYPLGFEYLFGDFGREEQKTSQEKFITKQEIIQANIIRVQRLFPGKKIIVIADGAFASIELLTWLVNHNIAFEMRMHSNRTITYNGHKSAIKKMKALTLRGRQTAKTIFALWHGIQLYITTCKRIDKHGKVTIIYLVSSFQDEAINHVNIYKRRWPIEKVFRTSKQILGLGQAQTRKYQRNHIAAVLLTYSFLVVEQKKHGYKNPEEAARALKRKKPKTLVTYFSSFITNSSIGSNLLVN